MEAEDSAAAATIAGLRGGHQRERGPGIIGFFAMARGLLNWGTDGRLEPRDCGIVGVLVMLFALGAVSSALDALQSITSSKSTSAQSSGSGKAAAESVRIIGDAGQQAGTVTPSSGSQERHLADFVADHERAACGAKPVGQCDRLDVGFDASSDPLQQLFALIDGNGDGNISKSEFENALGAGGTNLANADFGLRQAGQECRWQCQSR